MSKNYTDEQFIEAVKTSISVAEVLKKLGLKHIAGGSYRTVYNKAEKLGLDLSHFLGQASNKNRYFGPKRPIEDYLSNRKFIKGYSLKLRLIKEGIIDNKCDNCNLSEWNNEPIPTELHHLDGNYKNNNLDNLQILCPNCHAQTANYRGKNRKS